MTRSETLPYFVLTSRCVVCSKIDRIQLREEIICDDCIEWYKLCMLRVIQNYTRSVRAFRGQC